MTSLLDNAFWHALSGAQAHLARGETPFLYVLATNVRARRRYERTGFRLHCALPARAVARTRAA